MDEARERRPEETLRASAVSRSFEGVQALQDVTLELHRREVVGLVGPNGAGKSTLVNVLTGFDLPTSGTVELRDRDITGWSAHRRARSGLTRTFQHSRSLAGGRGARVCRGRPLCPRRPPGRGAADRPQHGTRNGRLRPDPRARSG